MHKGSQAKKAKYLIITSTYNISIKKIRENILFPNIIYLSNNA